VKIFGQKTAFGGDDAFAWRPNTRAADRSTASIILLWYVCVCVCVCVRRQFSVRAKSTIASLYTHHLFVYRVEFTSDIYRYGRKANVCGGKWRGGRGEWKTGPLSIVFLGTSVVVGRDTRAVLHFTRSGKTLRRLVWSTRERFRDLSIFENTLIVITRAMAILKYILLDLISRTNVQLLQRLPAR